MTDLGSSRWPAALGIVGGAALGVGIPYLIQTYGGDLPVTMRMLGISLALAAGGRFVRAGRTAATTHLVESNTQRRIA